MRLKDEELSPSEYKSLCEITKGLMAQTIPGKHAERLIELGLLVEKLGGLQLTSKGHRRLAKGK